MMHDHESREIAPISEEPRASFVLLSFLILFLAAVFFVNEADWQVSTYENHARSAADVESQVAAGSRSRQLSYVTIGAVGILLCLVSSRQQVNFLCLPFALFCLYALVCIASIIWTDTAWLTTKRLATSIFALLAIMGVARHLSIRDLIDATLGIATILLAISFYAELRLGTFAPWTSEYRFAGIMHPNSQGGMCSVMVIAAFFGMKASTRGKLVYLGFFILAGGFMLLTKSRTAVAACLCGISAAWFLVASRQKQTLLGLSFPAAVCAGLATLLLLGAELSSSASTATNLGRGADQDLISLNGRVPLWENMIQHIAQRPLLGYGYQGFWTPDRIYEVSLDQEWTVPNAHSVFLDVLLSTGLVGGAILGLALMVAFLRIMKRCLETKAPPDCFVFALFVYAFIASFFESGFAQPTSFEALITGTALLHVLSRRTQDESTLGASSRHAHPRSNWKAISAGGMA